MTKHIGPCIEGLKRTLAAFYTGAAAWRVTWAYAPNTITHFTKYSPLCCMKVLYVVLLRKSSP